MATAGAGRPWCSLDGIEPGDTTPVVRYDDGGTPTPRRRVLQGMVGELMSTAARRLTRVFLVGLAVTALAACDIAVNGEGGLHFDLGARAQDQWSRSYPLEAGGRLELINVNGRITAEPSEGAAVELTAVRTAKATSEEGAKELLGRIEMREEVGESRVRVEVRVPRLSGAGGHEVEWTVKVPRGVSVDLRTVNGGVHLSGLDGDVRARTTNGGIKASGLLATAVDAAVTNGGVEVELAKVAGTVRLEAVNGGVSVLLPSTSQVDIAARTVNGGISVRDLDIQSDSEAARKEGAAQTYRRRLDGRLNGGGARVELETVNGGVRIGRAVTTT